MERCSRNTLIIIIIITAVIILADICLYTCSLCMGIYMPKHTCRCKSKGRFVIYMSMGKLVNVCIYLYICQCIHTVYIYM